MNSQPRNATGICSLLGLAMFCVMSGSIALAQEDGWYVGINAGRAATDANRSRITTALQAGGYSTTQFSANDSDTTFKLLGGYGFTPNLGLEAAYFDLGNFDFHANLLPAAVQRGEASMTGFALDLVGTWPLQNRLAAFARAGISTTRIEQDFANGLIGTGFTNHTDRGTQGKYGVGLQYAFSDAFSVRTELERYRVDRNRVTDDKVDTFTVGLVYRFGSRPPVPAVARPTTPVPAPAPVPAPPVQITLSASTLFDFDRSELKPEGRQALDRLVRDMSGLNYDVVIVTGHTDRIGTRTYNLALSLRRADTVRTYLIGQGVAEGRITARGVNSDEPVTTAQQCTGPVSDALKACLQPDRRVVVEVSGTRQE